MQQLQCNNSNWSEISKWSGCTCSFSARKWILVIYVRRGAETELRLKWNLLKQWTNTYKSLCNENNSAWWSINKSNRIASDCASVICIKNQLIPANIRKYNNGNDETCLLIFIACANLLSCKLCISYQWRCRCRCFICYNAARTCPETPVFDALVPAILCANSRGFLFNFFPRFFYYTCLWEL